MFNTQDLTIASQNFAIVISVDIYQKYISLYALSSFTSIMAKVWEAIIVTCELNEEFSFISQLKNPKHSVTQAKFCETKNSSIRNTVFQVTTCTTSVR